MRHHIPVLHRRSRPVLLLLLAGVLTSCGSGVVSYPSKTEEDTELDRIGIPAAGYTLVTENFSGSTCVSGCAIVVDRDYAVATSFPEAQATMSALLHQRGYTVAAAGVVSCAILSRITPTGKPEAQMWCSFQAHTGKWDVTVLERMVGIDLTPYAPLPTGNRTLAPDKNPPLTGPVDVVEISIGPVAPAQPSSAGG